MAICMHFRQMSNKSVIKGIAIAINKQSVGKTENKALDGLTAQLGKSEFIMLPANTSYNYFHLPSSHSLPPGNSLNISSIAPGKDF